MRLCCHAGAALEKIVNLSQTVSLVELNLPHTSMDVHDLLDKTVPLSRKGKPASWKQSGPDQLVVVRTVARGVALGVVRGGRTLPTGAHPSEDQFEQELAALLAAAGKVLEAAPPKRKRRRRAAGSGAAQLDTLHRVEVEYPSVGTTVRASYERFQDHVRLRPLVDARKQARPCQFGSARLRALDDFVLSLNLGLENQTKLFNLLLFWEETMPGAPSDVGTSVPLRESFKSAHAFRRAIADEIYRAVIDDGWMWCTINEGGIEIEAFVRDALHECLKYLRAGKRVLFWSGGDSVAEPTDRREWSLDGDAFRLCEAKVVSAHGQFAFVPAIHIYSDSSVVSGSGGKFGGLCECASRLGRPATIDRAARRHWWWPLPCFTSTPRAAATD